MSQSRRLRGTLSQARRRNAVLVSVSPGTTRLSVQKGIEVARDKAWACVAVRLQDWPESKIDALVQGLYMYFKSSDSPVVKDVLLVGADGRKQNVAKRALADLRQRSLEEVGNQSRQEGVPRARKRNKRA
eukprot:CAMPEP_0196760890 /NCGR_PEP_ID=MMETSP1091-20130531/105468_1 /TAXON_ID=302021 /ORGANISM="Rhodomonas sp., Strain CCMP768" /LENGTH=129 /DNA_ID=CAMNT_0042109821 /DNA_START=932 /DNA_END=1320 /DNA_ORIENTATION=-